MNAPAGLDNRQQVEGPFSRLRALLAPFAPGRPPLDMALGEPQAAVEPWVARSIAAAADAFARYPAIAGTAPLREAIADWLVRRCGARAPIDPAHHILPTCGAREGLFFAILGAARGGVGTARPAVLFPDPSYPVYRAAAEMAGAEPVALPATRATGSLPDLTALGADEALLARTAVLILGSPANPQGAAAGADYLRRAIALARRHGFVVMVDECYSEIYDLVRPTSAVAAVETLDNLLVFNSLSKRSGLPGLRSGFCAGDPAIIASLGALRNVVAPQMPGPLQAASAAAWSDETHVSAARARHLQRLALANRHLGGRRGYHRPPAGFFLWLDVAPWRDTEFAAMLWRRQGLRVLPGSFMSFGGSEEPASHVRVALVHGQDRLPGALERLARGMDCIEGSPG